MLKCLLVVFYFLCIHFYCFCDIRQKKDTNYLYFGIVIVFAIAQLLQYTCHITHRVILCMMLLCDYYTGLPFSNALCVGTIPWSSFTGDLCYVFYHEVRERKKRKWICRSMYSMTTLPKFHHKPYSLTIVFTSVLPFVPQHALQNTNFLYDHKNDHFEQSF